MNQVDLFASLAHLTKQQLENNAAPDGRDMFDTWLGRSQMGRQIMLEESGMLALRDGNWKYIAPFPGKAFPLEIRNNATGYSIKIN